MSKPLRVRMLRGSQENPTIYSVPKTNLFQSLQWSLIKNLKWNRIQVISRSPLTWTSSLLPKEIWFSLSSVKKKILSNSWELLLRNISYLFLINKGLYSTKQRCHLIIPFYNSKIASITTVKWTQEQLDNSTNQISKTIKKWGRSRWECLRIRATSKQWSLLMITPSKFQEQRDLTLTRSQPSQMMLSPGEVLKRFLSQKKRSMEVNTEFTDDSLNY